MAEHADSSGLTERQQKWFASVREGLERETGRSLEDWVDLARACPESTHRRRLSWMKSSYGLGQNRASLILQAAFPAESGWSEPDDLARILWADPQTRALFGMIRDRATELPGTVTGQRKGFTAFSRIFQFAAAKPLSGAVVLGLAVPADAAPSLSPSGRQGWSERLTARMTLRRPEDMEAVPGLLREAWARS